jgi:hypothetical protein
VPKINILPAFKGHVVYRDLLQSQGTLEFVTSRYGLCQEDGVLFVVEDADFTFFLAVRGGVLILRRQEALLNLNLNDLPSPLEWVMLRVIWSLDTLQVTCGLPDRIINQTWTHTQPSAPPQSLLKWAREQNLLKVIEYGSAEEFRAKVYSSLRSMQEKIDETGAVRQFWDFSYDGNRIVSRIPKKETDVHGAVACILSDQMFIANIEVVPEYQTGVGNLDFMFLGHVKGEGSARLCAEFKNAHSKDILNGLTKQLPLYMRNTGAEYGAYCVLRHKGSWFNEPGETPEDQEATFRSITLGSADPLLRKIRVFAFDLSKPPPASHTSKPEPRRQVADKPGTLMC